jgi:hypothetical protein
VICPVCRVGKIELFDRVYLEAGSVAHLLGSLARRSRLFGDGYLDDRSATLTLVKLGQRSYE